MKKHLISLWFLLLISICMNARGIKPVEVSIWSNQAKLSNGEVEVQFTGNPLSLKIVFNDQEKVSFLEETPIELQYQEGVISLTSVHYIYRRYRGFVAELSDEQGGDVYADLQVLLDPSGHISMELLPRNKDKIDGIKVYLDQSADEHYYGLGDLWYTESVDVKGERIHMYNQTGTPDQCNYVPFFMSTGGYGLFIDNAYPGYIDFGQTSAGQTILDYPSRELSLHFWTGNDMKEILPQYLDFTGYPPMPPEWVFLPQKWRDESNWEEVFEDVNRMKAHDMPLSAMWLDRPWMHGDYGSDDFIFDKERYPNPEEHIQKLHDMDVRLLVWGCDFLTEDSKYFEEAQQKDYFVGGFGPQNEQNDLGRYLIDFANPEAREWFKDMIKDALKMGVDGIKLDRGQNYPLTVTPPSGRAPQAMHNYHSYLMVKTYAEALEEVRGDDYQFTPRAGWAGTQQWTVKWPGDLESNLDDDQGLPAVVRAQTAAGMTGFAFWGPDIPGYGSECSKLAFVRMVQQGTFSPLMQLAGKGDHNDVPFSWDEEAVQIYKFYAQLREKMLPYLLKYAEIAHKEGIPMVRHLALNWPDDPHVHNRTYQYMFGDELLVAPVVKESNTREIYLPEGVWVDFWDRDQVIKGPKTLTETVPLSQIPLYIKANAEFDFPLPETELPK